MCKDSISQVTFKDDHTGSWDFHEAFWRTRVNTQLFFHIDWYIYLATSVLAVACRIGNRLLSSCGAGALDCMGSVVAVHGLCCPTVWNTTFYPSSLCISFTPEETLIHLVIINRSPSLIAFPLTISLTHHWVYLQQSLLVNVQNSIPAREPTLQGSHLITSTLRSYITDTS